MMRGVLVIGNGFDLDLGLKTSYNDIFSGWEPSTDAKSSLLYQTIANEKLNQWNYLEENISKLYGKTRNLIHHFVENDELCHEEMRNQIILYLRKMDYKINKGSFAYKLINAIYHNEKFKIYSFNYTDSIVRCINKSFYVCHVHGKLEGNSIILGTEDNNRAGRNLCFLQKSFSPFYKSNDLKYSLDKCDTVIFFGHSLAKVDYLYFQQFFKKQSEDGLSEKDRKKIVIITYNEESRRNILFQLYSMNNNRLDLFYQQNDFEVILTDKENQLSKKYNKRFDILLDFLQQNSINADKARINPFTGAIMPKDNSY